jgi:hypothetical protein
MSTLKLERLTFALVVSALLVAAGSAVAQTPAPMAPAPNASPPQTAADELEPAVNTSAPAAPAAGPNTTTPAASPARTPSGSTPPPTSAPNTAARARTPPAARGRVVDRVQLDTTQITGNRELPKVLYIVPWKRSDLGDLGGRPVNSLLDEVLKPVDRDVFRRENRYFEAVKPDQPTRETGTASPPGAQPEK